ncbi:hypothetical protein [Paenibacillus sp. LjRoot56]|uniref:hypothetical protein n=1 Tax=Paenibacillus sp. LjRoot56 TaxID=3342333 RepID=UPI003ECE2798
MIKKIAICSLLITLSVQSSISVIPGLEVAHAANPTATINYSTSSETQFTKGFRGYNSPTQKGAMSYMDDDYINEVKNAEVGWVRYGAGTVVGNYNWKLGEVDDESVAQYKESDKQYFDFTRFSRYTYAKGKEHIKDFYESSRKIGAKLIFTVNTFTERPEDIADLAKYVKDNNIQVEYWQLGNEPYYFRYIGDLNASPKFYNGTNDYLNKAKAYNDAIKGVLPSAKTLVYYTPDPTDSENNAFNTYEANHSGHFWDGITFHQYNGDDPQTKSLTKAIQNTNTYLNIWENRLNTYENKSWGSAPIVVTEYGVGIGGVLENSHYAGMFVAESAVRASKNTNVKYMGGYRIYQGLVSTGNESADELDDVYQKGLTEDTTTWNFDVFNRAPALDLKVVDHAINSSSSLWQTTVTGGLTVVTDDSNDSDMPAIYSQAYKGDDGKNYVVIFNKSATAHDVTIQQNGTAISGTLTKTYVSAASDAQNTAANKTNVQIQSGTTTNLVTVPGYTVMRVEWTSARAAVVQPTTLSHAQVTGDGSVSLRWWPLDGVSNYKVQYGTSPGSYTNTIAVTGDTTTITGLTGGPYYFTVYPGTSSTVLSNEVKVTLAAPATPVVTRLYPKQSGEIAFEWQSVPGARGYNVKYGTSSSYTTTIDVGNVNGYKLTGLNNNTTYHVAVSAYNGTTNTSNGSISGQSANSADQTVVTKSNMPYAPNDLRIQSSGASSITLEWDASYQETIYDGFEDGSETDSIKDNINDKDDVWTKPSGTFSVVAHPTRSSSKVYQSGISASELSIAGNANWGNYDVEAKVEAGTWSSLAGVAVRSDAAGNNYYRLGLASADCSGSTASGQQYIKLQKVVNGSPAGDLVCKSIADIDDEYIGVTLTKATLSLKVNGSSLVGMLNEDVISDPVTDTSFTQGYAGVFSKNQQTMFDQFILRKSNLPTGNYKVYRSSGASNIYPGPGTLRGTVSAAPFYEFTDTGLTAGTQYYYRVVGSNTDGDSSSTSNIVPYKP